MNWSTVHFLKILIKNWDLTKDTSRICWPYHFCTSMQLPQMIMTITIWSRYVTASNWNPQRSIWIALIFRRSLTLLFIIEGERSNNTLLLAAIWRNKWLIWRAIMISNTFVILYWPFHKCVKCVYSLLFGQYKQVGAYGPLSSNLIYNPDFVKQKLLAHLCIVTSHLSVSAKSFSHGS